MKAKLIKYKQEMFTNYILKNENGDTIATTKYPFASETEYLAKSKGITLQRLSHENCDEIFGIYIPSELSKVLVEGERGAFEFGYCLAREHNKDKVFTLDDIRNAMDWIMTQYFEFHEQPTTGRREQYLESIQQPTEIEVEIEMEENIILKARSMQFSTQRAINAVKKEWFPKPKLDSEGCLILKKI